MKKTTIFIVCLTLISLLITILMAIPAHSQLIMTNQKMKIVKVERKFNRLQCRVHEDNKGNVQFVLIDGNTKFSTKGREVHYDKAWRLFKKDMIIRVKGGFTITGKIKAKTIYW